MHIIRNNIKPLIISLLTLLLLTSSVLVSHSYDLPWWTVDSGGGESIGDGYTLTGTIGQPDAGVSLTGDGYTLEGGFWTVSTVPTYSIYLPITVRSSP